jgi:hypothetical protein
MLMSKGDKGMVQTNDLFAKIRGFAAANARRGFVLLNAHLYQDPWVHLNGTEQLIFDFHAFPSRPQPVPSQPMDCLLNASFEDSIYTHSAGGVAVGGWRTSSLPYLVELDNYDCTTHPGVQAPGDTFHPFGWDEISWFAHQPPQYRNNWLAYAAEWLAQNDPKGQFEMPLMRCLCDAQFPKLNRSSSTFYDASSELPASDGGFDQEHAMAKIWGA